MQNNIRKSFHPGVIVSLLALLYFLVRSFI